MDIFLRILDNFTTFQASCNWNIKTNIWAKIKEIFCFKFDFWVLALDRDRNWKKYKQKSLVKGCIFFMW